MKPILFSIGSYTVTTLGFFLVLAFLAGLVVIWRVIRRFEIEKEITLDLFLLISILSLIGARIFFLILNPSGGNDLINFFLVNKIPGFSFWGGLATGLLSLKLLSNRFKLNFWQIADFAVTALFLGISISSLGCLFNSCQYGLVSNLPFAVNQAGLVGKRFPLQVFESTAFFLGFVYLWSQVLRFHFNGSIALKGFMLMGAVKFTLEFFRGDAIVINGFLSDGHIWSSAIFIYGAVYYYKISKRSFKGDLRGIWFLFQNPSKRKSAVSQLLKNWYNFRINFKMRVVHFKKNLFKILNIKSNPTNF